MPPDPLIVTARLDDESAATYDALRRRHFPPARNHLAAHLTLFHHLPGEELVTIREDLRRLAPDEPLPLASNGPRLLGRGVAIDLRSDELRTWHARLATSWRHWLTPQDRQPFRAHVTVQNKVSPDEARALHALLAGTALPTSPRATGWSLWWYRGGPWEHELDVDFSRPSPSQS